MERSDQDLIKKANSGNLDAFEKLVAKYEKKVYSVAYRFCGSHTDARDLAQEAFLKIYKGLPGFRGDASFSTWVYHITANVCRDELRRRQRDKTVILEEWPLEKANVSGKELADSLNNPESSLLQQELRDDIQQLLNALSGEQRFILVMREIEGFSYEEMAVQLGCNLGTVKSRLSRARQAFKEKYLARREQWEVPCRQTR